MFEQIRSEYGAEPKYLTEANFELNQGLTPSVRLGSGAINTLYATESGDRRLVAGQDVLSVHTLKPYEGWEQFGPRISRGLAAYVAAADPAGIRSVSIRYINRILVPGEAFALSDYFTVAPHSPVPSTAGITGFFEQLETSYIDSPARLFRTFASAGVDGDKAGFVLDLQVLHEWPNEPLPIHEVEGVIEALRGRERSAFEALITEEARKLFDD